MTLNNLISDRNLIGLLREINDITHANSDVLDEVLSGINI